MAIKIKLVPVLENGQFFVLEQLFDKGNLSEEYRHGPFSSSFESECYAEQRNNWYKDKVKPLYGSNRRAEDFVFIFPPP